MSLSKENKYPEIRFKGFIDAWEQRKLDLIFKKIRNAFVGTATPYYVEDGNFYLESNNVKDGSINRKTEIFINNDFYEKQKDKWLHTDDIVMVQSGHVGHTAVIPEELNNTAAHAVIMFQGYQQQTDPHFLNFQFQTGKAKKELSSITTGNTIKHILASEMKKFKVSVPQYEEQNKVGDFFKELDNAIALHQRKLEKLKSLKKAYLQVLFPSKIENAPKIRFTNLNQSWEQRKWKTAMKVNSGKDYKHLEQGEIPVYGTGGYMLAVNRALSNEDSIGIGRKGTIDKPQYLNAPFWTVDTLFYMTPLKNHNLQFLFFMSQKINWKKLDESTGVPSLSKVNIENLSQKFPVLVEQQKIGAFFDQLEKTITLHQDKLDKLSILKKAYLKMMFI